ncbi:MAG TPA: flagellar motor protein MotD [Steroidobacteraceae bacterium]|jgi:chemotaxis protein MotB
MSGPQDRRLHSRRRRRQDDHDNHEAWAIPYGDLVTLLLAFFVVMYAMSSVNEGKYRVLSDSLAEAFHGTPRSAQPLESDGSRLQPLEQMPLTQVHRMISSSLPARHIMPAPSAPAPAHPTTTPTADPATSELQSAPPSGDLDRVAEDVSAALAPLIASGNVRVRRYDSWVAVDISTDILFGSGVARLSGPAVTALQRLADTLRSVPNAVRVEGYTDDRPISTAAFPSNWELSAARAASVVRLFMDRGLAAERLAVVGYGQFRPAMANATPAGRNANRRVEVLIFNRDSGPDGPR